jgi:ribosomal-protein-alanine N-acetyltransferase
MLQSARLTFRRPTLDDMDALSGLWTDPDARRYLGGPVDAGQVPARIQAQIDCWEKHGFGMAVLELRSTKEVIGMCGLHPSDDDGIEISYLLYPPYWGHGYALEAAQTWLDHAFNALDLDHVIAITQEANAPSCRLLERLGMKHLDSFVRFGAIQRLYALASS